MEKINLKEESIQVLKEMVREDFLEKFNNNFFAHTEHEDTPKGFQTSHWIVHPEIMLSWINTQIVSALEVGIRTGYAMDDETFKKEMETLPEWDIIKTFYPDTSKEKEIIQLANKIDNAILDMQHQSQHYEKVLVDAKIISGENS